VHTPEWLKGSESVPWEEVLRRNPRERMKAEKHPVDILEELPELIRRGYENIPEEDIVRLQWYGLYHDKPRVGYFMMRIKLPGGILTPAQCAAIGQLARRFGDYAELTTRQDIQLHWVRLEDLPEVFAILHAAGLTTNAACGDTIRNITGCPVAGLDRFEAFDSTEDLLRLAAFFYDAAHRDYFNLPRKHKITISACAYHCNYPEIHDIAFVGVREGTREGYTVWIGGGLSTNPRIARPLGIFIPRDQVVAVARAILDIWREEPANRLAFVKARLKFFVDRIGPEEYRRRLEERLGHPLEDWPQPPQPVRREFHTGIHPQKQPGRFYVAFPVPAGKVNGDQLLGVARIAQEFGLRIRISQRQNLILSDIPQESLVAVIVMMREIGFPLQGSWMRATSIACTSDPYCNFSLNSSKELLLDLIDYLESRLGPIQDITISADGCPHACAHHWVGDIGLQASYLRKPDGSVEEALMVILGGGYGREAKIGRVVAKRVPVAEVKTYLENLIRFYRQSGPWRSFQEFANAYSDEALLQIMRNGCFEEQKAATSVPVEVEP